MSKNRSIVIVGAGIIGLSSGLWLQRLGFQVTIIDPEAPGSGASFGNAGVFADFACLPFAKFQMLRQIPSMLLDSESPLSIQAQYLPNLIPYSVGFAKACLPKNYQRGCKALTQLLTLAPSADEVLLKSTGAIDFVKNKGSLALLSTEKGFQKAKHGAMQERKECNVQLEFLTQNDVHDLEPDLAQFYSGGVYYPNSRHTTSPVGICQKYAEFFQQNGGIIHQEKVESIDASQPQIKIITPQRSLSCDQLIIAAGVASKYLLKPLGVNIPLVSERGYHLELSSGDRQLSRPVSWLDKSIFSTPMVNGIRVAGTAEFAFSDSPVNKQQLKTLSTLAKKMLGEQSEIKSRWVGSRPSTPDSLPVIGPLEKHPNIILAFGHGHVGLTLASITGQLVSQSITGDKPSVDLEFFSPSRFN